nr:MAG TPA: hypothetical protein [Caudoviricetes sp.]
MSLNVTSCKLQTMGNKKAAKRRLALGSSN